MIDRPPLPSIGHSVDSCEGYHRNADCGGGRIFKPVLFFERFSGLFTSNGRPGLRVTKSNSEYGSFGPTNMGQPKLPAFLARFNSSYPFGPTLISSITFGPTSPQYTQS